MYKRGWKVNPSNIPAIVARIKGNLGNRFGNMGEDNTPGIILIIHPLTGLFGTIPEASSCTISLDYITGDIELNSGNLPHIENMYHSWDHYMNDLSDSIQKSIFN